MRLILSLATLALLAACAPASLSSDDARAAMKARMERPGATQVKVQQMHTFELADCTDTAATGTVTCQVRMDVSFDYGGVTQRDAGADRIRFAREDGTWVAYPAD
jgi:hypothetical protein